MSSSSTGDTSDDHDNNPNKRDSEKKRRDQENVYLEELSQLISLNVPEFSDSDDSTITCDPRTEKGSILKETVDRLRQIRSEYTRQDKHLGRVLSVQQVLPKELIGSLVLEALDGFMFIVSREGRIEFISESVTDFLGLQQESYIGESIYRYVHQGDHARFSVNLKTWKRETPGQQQAQEQEENKIFNVRFRIEKIKSEPTGNLPKTELYEDMQVSAVEIHSPKQKIESDSALVCIARRIPANEDCRETPVESFTTQIDLETWTVGTVDTSGLPEEYVEVIGRHCIGRKLTDIVHPQDTPLLNLHLQMLQRDGAHLSRVYRLVFPAPHYTVHVKTKSKIFKPDSVSSVKGFVMSTHHIVRENEVRSEVLPSLRTDLLTSGSAGSDLAISRQYPFKPVPKENIIIKKIKTEDFAGNINEGIDLERFLRDPDSFMPILKSGAASAGGGAAQGSLRLNPASRSQKTLLPPTSTVTSPTPAPASSPSYTAAPLPTSYTANHLSVYSPHVSTMSSSLVPAATSTTSSSSSSSSSSSKMAISSADDLLQKFPGIANWNVRIASPGPKDYLHSIITLKSGASAASSPRSPGMSSGVVKHAILSSLLSTSRPKPALESRSAAPPKTNQLLKELLTTKENRTGASPEPENISLLQLLNGKTEKTQSDSELLRRLNQPVKDPASRTKLSELAKLLEARSTKRVSTLDEGPPAKMATVVTTSGSVSSLESLLRKDTSVSTSAASLGISPKWGEIPNKNLPRSEVLHRFRDFQNRNNNANAGASGGRISTDGKAGSEVDGKAKLMNPSSVGAQSEPSPPQDLPTELFEMLDWTDLDNVMSPDLFLSLDSVYSEDQAQINAIEQQLKLVEKSMNQAPLPQSLSALLQRSGVGEGGPRLVYPGQPGPAPPSSPGPVRPSYTQLPSPGARFTAHQTGSVMTTYAQMPMTSPGLVRAPFMTTAPFTAVTSYSTVPSPDTVLTGFPQHKIMPARRGNQNIEDMMKGVPPNVTVQPGLDGKGLEESLGLHSRHLSGDSSFSRSGSPLSNPGHSRPSRHASGDSLGTFHGGNRPSRHASGGDSLQVGSINPGLRRSSGDSLLYNNFLRRQESIPSSFLNSSTQQSNASSFHNSSTQQSNSPSFPTSILQSSLTRPPIARKSSVSSPIGLPLTTIGLSPPISLTSTIGSTSVMGATIGSTNLGTVRTTATIGSGLSGGVGDLRMQGGPSGRSLSQEDLESFGLSVEVTKEDYFMATGGDLTSPVGGKPASNGGGSMYRNNSAGGAQRYQFSPTAGAGGHQYLKAQLLQGSLLPYQSGLGSQLSGIRNQQGVGGNQLSGGGNQLSGGGNQLSGGGIQLSGGGNQLGGGGNQLGGSGGVVGNSYQGGARFATVSNSVDRAGKLVQVRAPGPSVGQSPAQRYSVSQQPQFRRALTQQEQMQLQSQISPNRPGLTGATSPGIRSPFPSSAPGRVSPYSTSSSAVSSSCSPLTSFSSAPHQIPTTIFSSSLPLETFSTQSGEPRRVASSPLAALAIGQGPGVQTNQGQVLQTNQGQLLQTSQGQLLQANQGQLFQTNKGQIIQTNQRQLQSNQGQLVQTNQGPMLRTILGQEQIQTNSQHHFLQTTQGQILQTTQGQLLQSNQGQLLQSPQGNLISTGSNQLGQTTQGHIIQTSQGPLIQTTQGQLIQITQGPGNPSGQGLILRSSPGQMLQPTQTQALKSSQGHVIATTQGQVIQTSQGQLVLETGEVLQEGYIQSGQGPPQRVYLQQGPRGNLVMSPAQGLLSPGAMGGMLHSQSSTN